MLKLLAVVVMFPVFSNAQYKGDNTIIIDTSISANDLKSILFQKGFMAENQDSVFIITSPKQITGAVIMKLFINRSETKVVLKGEFKITVEGELWGTTIKQAFQPVMFVKSKQNLNYPCWAEMNNIASLIGSKITYLKQ